MKLRECILGTVIWVSAALLLAAMLGGCSLEIDINSKPKENRQLDQLQDQIDTETYLRQQVFERVTEYYRLGGLVAQSNPYLSVAERYEIGRSILSYSEERGLNPLLVVAVIIVESKGRLYATSRAGALGLMQVMPHMAREDENLFVIDTNIGRGTFILADNIKRWGQVEGVARYFWGTKVTPDGRYYAKIQKALEGLNG